MTEIDKPEGDMVENESRAAAPEVPVVPSRPLRVTLYEDRAEVTRTATVTLDEGLQWVALGDVSPFIDDRSVQARVVGEAAEVISARVSRRVTLVGQLGREQIDALEETARNAELRAAAAMRAASRAESTIQRLGEIFGDWVGALAEVPREVDSARIASWKQAHDAVENRHGEVVRAAAGHREQVRKAQLELANATGALGEAQRQEPCVEARVEVQIDATAAAERQVEITYRTPCAQWRPEHLARLVVDADDPAKGRVEIITWATAWQATGERWDDIEVCFSTARPASAASAPLLADDVVHSRRKTAEERREIVVVATEKTIATAGGEESADVDELPSVDDGGEPVVLKPAARISLVSDGQPHRAEVGRVEMAVEVDRVLMPEAAPVAHIQATLKLDAERPLLAGPMRVVRGEVMVGRSRADFVAPGDQFTLGFGPDDAIRVRRRVDQTRDRTPVVGTQHIEREVVLYLSNMSGHDKDILVRERIPVSDIEQVEVQLGKHDGWEVDETDGFLSRRVSLGDRENRELSLSYEVTAKSNVNLPF